MTIDSLTRALPLIAVAATIVVFPPTDAAAQLVADAEFREACEVLRLGGALDVPEWLAFSRPPSLKLDPTGRLYLRGGDPHVTVLDPDGGFVRYVGGEGEGPGEFTLLGGFGFVGDTVWLQHSTLLHMAFFDSTGAHIRTEMDRGTPSYAPQTWRISIPLARGRGFYIPASGNVSEKRVPVPMTVGIRSAPARDTLGFRLNNTWMTAMGATTWFRPMTTPPLYRIHAKGNSVVTAGWETDRPEELVLRHHDVYGRVVGETTIGSRLRPVSADARDAFIDEGVERAVGGAALLRRVGGEVPTDVRDAVMEGLLLYDYFEPISDFFVTRDERVWLRDAAPADGYEALWVVLGPDGEPEFRVPAPTGVTFEAALGELVWGTGLTELDIPYIVQLELRPPGACR